MNPLPIEFSYNDIPISQGCFSGYDDRENYDDDADYESESQYDGIEVPDFAELLVGQCSAITGAVGRIGAETGYMDDVEVRRLVTDLTSSTLNTTELAVWSCFELIRLYDAHPGAAPELVDPDEIRWPRITFGNGRWQRIPRCGIAKGIHALVSRTTECAVQLQRGAQWLETRHGSEGVLPLLTGLVDLTEEWQLGVAVEYCKLTATTAFELGW